MGLVGAVITIAVLILVAIGLILVVGWAYCTLIAPLAPNACPDIASIIIYGMAAMIIMLSLAMATTISFFLEVSTD